ncbi:sporulation membrane protein YtaF [uncultured Clostridium sp.]|jgi:putative sporulation protein YtaF|uniref:sporulation membrane protein YtaF n=1 Tax=uncultured Clostridium sp. TaxID=59620 RepID=UPI002618A31E|nr:sporulation membrane protein YtaF [uncultured Clostridium sp.]
MTLIPILLFVLSASLDTFMVSLAYGTKNIRIGFLSNLVIAFVSALGTFLSMIFGAMLINILSIKSANLLGAFVLLILGVYFILDYRKTKHAHAPECLCSTGNSCSKAILKFPEIADTDKSGSIELRESVTLALALAINNFALGLAASITGLDVYLTTIFTFIFSIILIPLGIYVSKRFLNKFIAEKGSLISGVIILFLALIEALN